MASSGVNRDAVAAAWSRRGFGCDWWIDAPGRRWEDFTHDVDELVMVVEGEMEFELAGKVVRPRPGEELIIPAGTRHSARNVGGTTARWLYGYRER
jgi:mannose-6-phosphate isomerase-like protein (cupin superfamily)